MSWLRLGIAVEFTRAAHPQDNGAHEQMHRVLKADTAAPPAHTLRAQKRRIGRWIGCYNGERPQRSVGSASAARFYRPSPHRMPRRLKEPRYRQSWKVRRVRNRGHIKGRASAFYWARLCRPAGRTQNNRQRQPRSLPRSASDRLAVRARFGGNATGLDRTSFLKPMSLEQSVTHGIGLSLSRAMPVRLGLSATSPKRSLRGAAACASRKSPR